MANQKISELTELASGIADDDVLPIVDTGDAATKKVQYLTLKTEILGDLVTRLEALEAIFSSANEGDTLLYEAGNWVKKATTYQTVVYNTEYDSGTGEFKQDKIDVRVLETGADTPDQNVFTAVECA